MSPVHWDPPPDKSEEPSLAAMAEMVEREIAALEKQFALLAPLASDHPALARQEELKRQQAVLAQLLELERMRNQWRKVHCTNQECEFSRRRFLGSRTGQNYAYFCTDHQVDAPVAKIHDGRPGQLTFRPVYVSPEDFSHWRHNQQEWYELPCVVTCPACAMKQEVQHEIFPLARRKRQLEKARRQLLKEQQDRSR